MQRTQYKEYLIILQKGTVTFVRVLLCSYFKFPEGDAGALRHQNFANMLQELKHEVLIVGLGPYCGFEVKKFKCLCYTSLRQANNNVLGKVKSRLEYWKHLRNIIDEYRPDAIIMDDMRPIVTIKLKRFCKKHKIKLIHDSVEWYSSEQFKLGIFSPMFINKNIVNRFLIDNTIKVIAISKYLEDYYKNKGIQCVNIPIVASNEDLIKEKTLEENINIIYAGQAGRKDYIDVIISAINLLTEKEQSKIKFHILGCNEKQIIKSGMSEKSLDSVRTSLKIYGRVSRNMVLEVLKSSDFMVLMRSETQRYAKAGFPTKLVESLSHSTAMIANITSDMDHYLVNEYNSLIVPNCSPEALAFVLKKAINLSLEQRMEMCANSYKTVTEKLHYKYFLNELERILN